MKRKAKIVFVAQDPGGFDAIAPVIKNLQKDRNFQVLVFLRNQSRDLAKELGIKYIDANDLAIKTLGGDNPDLIFSATSSGESIEKEIIQIARIENIPTISAVDYWSGYKERFGESLEYSPDYFLVVDEKMKTEIASLGIPKNKIYITGNPRFDKFSGNKVSAQDKDLIVFYSQPFSEQLNKDFNEVDILKDVLEAIEKVYPNKEVVVKFHPKEANHHKFDEIIKAAKIKVRIETKLNAEQLSKKAGLIMGINSIVLFDAVLMGKPVISYQPNQKKEKDALISNTYGWSVPVYKKDGLTEQLKNIYTKPCPNKEALEKYTDNKSTEKVINFIKEILKIK